MDLTIREIMEIRYFKFSHILNGNIGLDNKVSCMTIMDIPHITSWLRGNELLISGVYLEESFTQEFIEQLLAVQCAGIVTKEKFTTKLPQHLIDFCSEKGLPIILVPDHCSWSDLMNPVNNAIIEKQYKSIEDTNRFHNILIQSVIKQNSLVELCGSIIQATGSSLAIMTSGNSLLAASDNLPWVDYLQSFDIGKQPTQTIAISTDGYKIMGTVFQSSALRDDDLKVFVYPIKESGELYGYFAVAKSADTDFLAASEIIKIQFSGLIFALKVSQQREIQNSTKYYHSLVLNELLHSDELSEQDIAKFGTALGKSIREKYRVLSVSIRTKWNQIYVPDTNAMHRIRKSLIEKSNAYEEVLIFEYQEYLVMLIPILPNCDIIKTIKAIHSSMAFLETENQHLIYIGAGNEHPFIETQTGYNEALQALNYAMRYNICGKCCYYKSLGVLRFLADNSGNLNSTFINELMAQYVTPLVAYDAEKSAQLVATLESYFSNNLSSLRTCKDLFIHKNTLRARIKKIESLIGTALDGDELFNAQLAFKVKELLLM